MFLRPFIKKSILLVFLISLPSMLGAMDSGGIDFSKLEKVLRSRDDKCETYSALLSNSSELVATFFLHEKEYNAHILDSSS